MTTREEFALRFAVSAYGIIMGKLMDKIDDPPLWSDLEKLDRQTIKGAVEMADLLIDQLAKDKSV